MILARLLAFSRENQHISYTALGCFLGRFHLPLDAPLAFSPAFFSEHWPYPLEMSQWVLPSHKSISLSPGQMSWFPHTLPVPLAGATTLGCKGWARQQGDACTDPAPLLRPFSIAHIAPSAIGCMQVEIFHFQVVLLNEAPRYRLRIGGAGRYLQGFTWCLGEESPEKPSWFPKTHTWTMTGTSPQPPAAQTAKVLSPPALVSPCLPQGPQKVLLFQPPERPGFFWATDTATNLPVWWQVRDCPPTPLYIFFSPNLICCCFIKYWILVYIKVNNVITQILIL